MSSKMHVQQVEYSTKDWYAEKLDFRLQVKKEISLYVCAESEMLRAFLVHVMTIKNIELGYAAVEEICTDFSRSLKKKYWKTYQ